MSFGGPLTKAPLDTCGCNAGSVHDSKATAEVTECPAERSKAPEWMASTKSILGEVQNTLCVELCARATQKWHSDVYEGEQSHDYWVEMMMRLAVRRLRESLSRAKSKELERLAVAILNSRVQWVLENKLISLAIQSQQPPWSVGRSVLLEEGDEYVSSMNLYMTNQFNPEFQFMSGVQIQLLEHHHLVHPAVYKTTLLTYSNNCTSWQATAITTPLRIVITKTPFYNMFMKYVEPKRNLQTMTAPF